MRQHTSSPPIAGGAQDGEPRSGDSAYTAGSPGLAIVAPISAGELVDKITILRVKAERLADPRQLGNVRRELAALERLARAALVRTVRLEKLARELTRVNAALWDIEEGKRDCERRQDFGPDFVRLARSVYVENDHRAAIKRAINEETGSELIEEKSYQPYKTAGI